MLLIFIVCGFCSLRNTSELALHGEGGVAFTGNAVMADPAAACAICKGTTLPGALKYRSWKESTGASGPTAVSSSELSCWRRSESVLRVLVFTMPRERSNGFKTEGTLQAV